MALSTFGAGGQTTNVVMTESQVRKHSNLFRVVLNAKHYKLLDDPLDEMIWVAKDSGHEKPLLSVDKIVYLDGLLLEAAREGKIAAAEILGWHFVARGLALQAWGCWITKEKFSLGKSEERKKQALTLGAWMGASEEYLIAFRVS